jgi:hypothetical protein
MIGITDDHEFKTHDEWKFFHEIDINKDELYCWNFKAVDVDPCDKMYLRNNIENNRFVRESSHSYIKPNKKHFNLSNDCDLFHICNRHIDTIVTLNYGLPVVMVHSENKFDEWSDVEPVIDIQKRVNDIFYSQDEDDGYGSYIGMFTFTENRINNHHPPRICYRWWDVMYQLEPSDFKRLTTRDKSIISFTMPSTGDKLKSWRPYVRRNGKEFWL